MDSPAEAELALVAELERLRSAVDRAKRRAAAYRRASYYRLGGKPEVEESEAIAELAAFVANQARRSQ